MNKSKQNNFVKRFLTLACIKLFYMLSNQLLFMRQIKFTFLFFVAILLVNIRIHAQAPNISYTGSTYSFVTGAAITPLTPTNSGSAVPATTLGAVSTFAGGGPGGNTNGTGTAASFSYPDGAAVDAAGNVYVSSNHRIRKITSAGVVSTFAGSAPGSTDATGTAASFSITRGLAVDAAGNVYVADEGNHKIRKITPAGVVSTLAGSGTIGSADGPGISASFNLPTGVAVDAAGNVYVADRTNHKIRKITSAGVVSTLAGSGAQGSTDATGILASFNFPTGIEVDAAGNVYVAEAGNYKIRKITSAGVVSTLAGSGALGSTDGPGTAASFYIPHDVAVDALGNVYVGEDYKIRKITSAGVVSTLAGMGWPGGFADGIGTAAKFGYLEGVALDATGNIYVADNPNHRIRKVSLYGYSISPALPAGLSFDGTTGIISGTPTVATPATNYTITASNAAGTSTVVISVATLLQPPTITNISPASGTTVPGQTVTITGTNFNTTAASNIVQFGAVKATVTAATATSLTVTAPVGATYAPVIALNATAALSGSSLKPFLPTFAGKGSFTQNDMMAAVEFNTLASCSTYVALGDLDGDGKPDLVTANSCNNTISVFRNISVSGTIDVNSFASKVDFATGNSPYYVAIGDLDGDGQLDLAVANYTGSTVSVFRNTCVSGVINASSFAAKIDFATGTNPVTLAIGDLDGDGKPDLVTANQNGNSLSLLRNTSASGTINSSSFAAGVDLAMLTGSTPRSVAIGDLDGDGKPDLAVSNLGVDAVSVFRNTSSQGIINTGSFAAQVNFATPASSFSTCVAIGDLDGDGKPDLAVSNSYSITVASAVSIFRNTSSSGSITTASFAAKVDLFATTSASSVAFGDLDGDGKPDLVVTPIYGAVSVCRNVSSSGVITSASFATNVDFTVGNTKLNVVIGDMDGDGRPDIVGTKYGFSTTHKCIYILRNNPSGPAITGISPASGTTVPGQTVTLTGTNFNTTAASNIVRFGAVNATVTAATATSLTVTAPAGATYAPVTALNATLALSGSSTKPFLPTFAGKGSFTINDILPKVNFATTGTQQPYYVAIGDIDGDGKPDLAVANYANGTVSVYHNTSTLGAITTASFAARVDFATGTNPISVSIGDLDGDGKPELAVTNYGSASVSVYRNTATSGTITTASFATKVDYTTGSNPRSVAIVDLDADGKPDLAVANTSVSTVSILRNTSATGTISFLPKVDYATGANPHFVAIGDLDGDGKPDLATANNGSASVSVLRNNSTIGTIALDAKVDFTAGAGPISIAIGDLDADGKAELVVTNFTDAGVSVLKNTAVSGFITSTSLAAKVDFASGAGAWAVAIGDLDGDAKPDLAVANAGVSTVSVLRNISAAFSITTSSFAAKVDFATTTATRCVAIGDLDGDGKSDFVTTNYTNATISVFRNNPSAFISFNANAGTGSMANQKISYQASANLTANAFTRTGYTFAGWATTSGGAVSYLNSASYTMGATDVTLYAKWTANTLTVTYNSQLGSAIASGTTTTGAPVAASPGTPTRAGYTFNGWFAASTGGAAITFPYTHSQTANFTLFAQWTANTLTVTYNSQLGSAIASGTTTTGASISASPGTPTRTGYSFNGWFAASTGGAAISFPYAHSKTANFTLFAQWTANTLTVTYNSQLGSAIASGTTTTGASIAASPGTPTRAGYTFNGWFAATTGGAAITFPYTHSQTANFTLFAQWQCAPTSSTETITDCGSYSWHGTTYTTSNSTASWVGTNAAGCDSTVMLNLTINSVPTASINPSSGTLTCATTSIDLVASGGVSYLWNATGGNATTSNTLAAAAGTYSVTVTGANGCTATASAVIGSNTIAPTANVTPSSGTLTCTTTSIDLTASGGVSYLWNATGGNATTSNTLAAAAGNYFVTVTGANGCTATASAVIGSNTTAPTASITASSGTLTCATTSIDLTASGGDTYLWNATGGNATTSITLAAAAGTYTVTVTDANGCTAIASTVIGSNTTAPTASVTPSSGEITCTTTSIDLTASGGVSYLWDDNSTSATRTVTSGGTYSVTVRDANGCTATASAVIGSNTTAPTANVAPSSGTLTCAITSIDLVANGGVSYLWNSTGGNVTTSNTLAATAGTYSVTVTGANGCTAIASAVIGSNTTPPTASVTPSSGEITCATTSINLVASGGVSYLWNSTGGNATTSNTLAAAAGTYSVTVTGDNGCTAIASAVIGSNTTPPTAAQVTGINSICTADNTSFTASASGTSVATTYAWSGPSSFSANTATINNLTTAGLYTCIICNDNGCTASTSNTLTINPLPIASTITASGATTFCSGGSVTLSGNNGGVWSTSETTPSIDVTTSGTYSVSTTNSCGSTTSNSIVVTVNTCNTIATTQLRSIDCGKISLTLYAQIACVAVAGATNYEFEFTNATTNAFYATKVMASIAIAGNNVTPNLQWNTQYNCRVRAKVGGVWGIYGSVCLIGLVQDPAIAGVPNTQLNSTSCNQLNLLPTATIVCQQISMSAGYEFEFTDLLTNAVTTKLSSLTYLPLATVTPTLIPMHTYSVRVRAKQYITWGSYGEACNIRILGATAARAAMNTDQETVDAMVLEMEEQSMNTDMPMEILLYPNPMMDVATVVISSIQNEKVTIAIIDITGKVVSNDIFNTNSTFSIQNSELRSGIYFLTATTSGGERKTIKVVKQ